MTQSDRPRLAPETLDLLLSLTRDAPDAQLRAVDAIDSKIVQAFAAGTVLIGLPALHGTGHHRTSAALFGVAVIAFLVLACYAVRALWSRRFRVMISPDQLWNDYWDESPQSIKHAVVADLASAYVENDFQMHEKRRALGRVLVAVGIEAISIGSALAVSAL